MSPRSGVASAALSLLLAGCSAAEPTGREELATPSPAAAPADAELVAQAGLAPCPPSEQPDGDASRLPGPPLPCLGPGPAVSLAGLAGEPTVVNLWASWCAPCVEELPALQAVHAGGGLRVLGVLTQDRARQGLAAAAGLGVRFPSVVDEQGAVLRSLGLRALPATVLLRPDGTVAHRYVGPPLDEAAVRRLAAEHLGVPAEAL